MEDYFSYVGKYSKIYVWSVTINKFNYKIVFFFTNVRWFGCFQLFYNSKILECYIYIH